jgi:hypothetical protein
MVGGCTCCTAHPRYRAVPYAGSVRHYCAIEETREFMPEIVTVNLTRVPGPKPVTYGILLNRTLLETNKFHSDNPMSFALVFFTRTVEEVPNFSGHTYNTLPIYVGNEKHIDLAIKAWLDAFLRGTLEFECILDEREWAWN